MPLHALLALVLDGAASAQDASPLDPPLSVAGAPWSVEATAFALPPTNLAFVTTEDRFHVCHVDVAWTPPSAPVATSSCPEPFATAAIAATSSWTFQAPADVLAVVNAPPPADGTPPAGGTPPPTVPTTRFGVDYVLQYDATVGVLTIVAEVDPGPKAAFDGTTGVPGLRLVHPAAPKKPIVAKGPKKTATSPCHVRASVDAMGRVTAATSADCPDAVASAATSAVTKAKWTAKVVDGRTEPSEVVIDVAFR